MLKILLLVSLFTIVNANPQGKFCGNIIGNPLNISLLNSTANISANVFGNKMSCNNEPYNFTDNHIYLSGDPKDCVNTHLKQWNVCPCPPHILYKDDSLEIEDTPIGAIELKSC
jgi:hypothetical protein